MNKWLEPSTPDSAKYERMGLAVKVAAITMREKVIPALVKLGESIHALHEAHKKKEERNGLD